jgi:hypothetical protein
MRPRCYGGMFPSLNPRDGAASQEGRVFGIRIETLGIGSTGFDVLVDQAQWERCIGCPDYRTCYDLSSARFKLAQVAGGSVAAVPQCEWPGPQRR